MKQLKFRCPSCQALLLAPVDRAKTKARCKKCGKVVTIPTPSEDAQVQEDATAERTNEPRTPAAHGPEEREDAYEVHGGPTRSEEIRERRRRRHERNLQMSNLRAGSAWRKVWNGLRLLLAIQFFMLVWRLLPLLTGLFGWGDFLGGSVGLSPGRWIWAILGGIFFLLFLGEYLLPLASAILFTFVPLRGMAKTLALTSLTVGIFSLLLVTVQHFASPSRTVSTEDLSKSIETDVERMVAKWEKELEEELQQSRRESELRRRALKGDKEAEAALKKHQEAQLARQKEARERAKQAQREREEASKKQQEELQKSVQKSILWGQLLKVGWYVMMSLFLLFLQAVARNLKAWDLADSCLIPIILQVARVLLELGFTLLVGKAPMQIVIEGYGSPLRPASTSWLEGLFRPLIQWLYWLYDLMCTWVNVRLLVKLRDLVSEKME